MTQIFLGLTGAFLLCFSSLAFAEPVSPVQELRYSEGCILKLVASRLELKLNPQVPLPQIHRESRTPLEQFQDAIEPQWGFRPEVFLNAYVVATNEIYLMDQARHYREGRAPDDSLAHELVHYLQVKYQGFTLEDLGEMAEADAVAVQTWFRETFLLKQPASDPCL
ncbi:MAG: hypothetical protein NDJ89_12340 [Oligoflexia bacterium]|nr:hypothetical protein [Oligoflexia bacterium]